MRKTLTATLMAITLALAFSSQPVFAQAAGEQPAQMPMMPKTEKSMNPEDRAMAVPRAGEIIGLKVTNDQRQELGHVKDLIVSSDGRISYLVVSRGGVLGIGDKLCAIPWQASNPRIHEGALLVDLTKERFEGAPVFVSWDDFRQGGYESKVRAYYGEESGFQDRSSEPMERTPKAPSAN